MANSCSTRVCLERLQIRDTDLDTLEKVVGIVAFGDLDAEDTCNLTHLNFLRIFRLSQLTAEYLLHVQDHLAQENSHLKVPCVSSFVCAAWPPQAAIAHIA